MPLVVLPEDLIALGIDHHGLDCGRAHIESHQKLGVVVLRLGGRRGDLPGLKRSDLYELRAFVIVHSRLSS
jgi:hypothetical protein